MSGNTASFEFPSVLPENWAEMVKTNLLEYFSQQQSHYAALGTSAENWLSQLADFIVGGGKRVRPTFVWLGWLAGGGERYPELSDAMTRVAASLEFVQAGALIHDDIIDASDTRRGKPAVHRIFEAAHATQKDAGKVLGDSADYGEASAILLGDIALCWADDMFLTAGLTAPALQRALPYWSAMRTEMLTGQYLDIHGETLPTVDADNARRVNRFKTAAYTIERPLHIGGACAGMSSQMKEILSDYGVNLGVAYQLRDDILGVLGDSSVTGKPSGGDISEGKRTVLLSHALKALKPNRATKLWNLVGKNLDEEELALARELIVESGAIQESEREIAELSQKAASAVAALRNVEGVSPQLGDAFEAMIEKVIRRTF